MPAPPKFRPYFTSAELSEIISALKSQPTPARMPLIRYLEGFAIEIERGIRSPNHVPTPNKRQAFIESLELEPNTGAVISAEQSNLQAYNKWVDHPTRCTPQQIAKAMEYRYLNNLMSETEEREYERANGL